MVANNITIGLTLALSLVAMLAISILGRMRNNNLPELPPT